MRRNFGFIFMSNFRKTNSAKENSVSRTSRRFAIGLNIFSGFGKITGTSRNLDNCWCGNSGFGHGFFGKEYCGFADINTDAIAFDQADCRFHVIAPTGMQMLLFSDLPLAQARHLHCGS
jgi:hypothetical protein